MSAGLPHSTVPVHVVGRHVGEVPFVPALHECARDIIGCMWAATAWDDSNWGGVRARGWTVMGRLRDRTEALTQEAKVAQRREAERASSTTMEMLSVASMHRRWQDQLKAKWSGGPSVVALLFAPPDTAAMDQLDARGEIFDLRTGTNWDLFFPGYYNSPESQYFEHQAGARSVGHGYAQDWFFSARDFDMLRREVEEKSEGRWSYSGTTDLVLINVWLAKNAPPTIDWASTLSGSITDPATGVRTLTLAEIIERISRDIERGLEDPAYGVAKVTTPAEHQDSGGRGQSGQGFVGNVLSNIVASLVVKGTGLG